MKLQGHPIDMNRVEVYDENEERRGGRQPTERFCTKTTPVQGTTPTEKTCQDDDDCCFVPFGSLY